MKNVETSYEEFIHGLDDRRQWIGLSNYRTLLQPIYESLEDARWPDILDTSALSIFKEGGMGARSQAKVLMDFFDYERLIHPWSKTGRWKIKGKNVSLYYKRSLNLSQSELYDMARDMSRKEKK